MPDVPNVLLRFHRLHQEAAEQCPSRIWQIAPQHYDTFLPARGDNPDHGTALLGVALAYATAWWWVTGQNDKGVSEVLIRSLSERMSREPGLNDQMERLALEGEPLLRQALGLSSVSIDTHAAHDALKHLYDLCNAMQSRGAEALGLCHTILCLTTRCRVERQRLTG